MNGGRCGRQEDASRGCKVGGNGPCVRMGKCDESVSGSKCCVISGCLLVVYRRVFSKVCGKYCVEKHLFVLHKGCTKSV